MGFTKISELNTDLSMIPKVRGVYIVVRPEKVGCSFTEIGTGGYFKDRNPNEEIHVLQQNWIKDANIIYIGKVGGENNQATLYSRLKQYIDFGLGKKIGHWGGRYIWQISEIQDYQICWKVLPNIDPRSYEKELLRLFF